MDSRYFSLFIRSDVSMIFPLVSRLKCLCFLGVILTNTEELVGAEEAQNEISFQTNEFYGRGCQKKLPVALMCCTALATAPFGVNYFI